MFRSFASNYENNLKIVSQFSSKRFVTKAKGENKNKMKWIEKVSFSFVTDTCACAQAVTGQFARTRLSTAAPLPFVPGFPADAHEPCPELT